MFILRIAKFLENIIIKYLRAYVVFFIKCSQKHIIPDGGRGGGSPI